MSPTPDHELSLLFERAQAGCQEAAKTIVERYRDPIKRVIRRKLRPTARRACDSDDLLQNLWLAFFQKAHDLTFSCPRQLLVFLQRAAVNAVREVHRNELCAAKRRHHRQAFPDHLVDDVPAPDQLAEVEDEWRRLLAALPGKEDWSLAFDLLRRGYTHAEVAQELSVSERTIDRLLERARESCATSTID